MTNTEKNYLASNSDYWEKGYNAPNVDHHVFRFFGRILKPDFNLPQNHEKLLDFGCGQGAAVNFFALNGFDAYGTDISNFDISIARARFTHISDKFEVCQLDPAANKNYGPADRYKVITAFQSLYYFTKSDFEVLMQKLYDQLEPGGVFFATMMGTKSKEFYDNSESTDDPWLRKVSFKNSRVSVDDYYMFFVESEEDLKDKFKMFEPVHIGHYGVKLSGDEGDGFHYTFCGVKK